MVLVEALNHVRQAERVIYENSAPYSERAISEMHVSINALRRAISLMGQTVERMPEIPLVVAEGTNPRIRGHK